MAKKIKYGKIVWTSKDGRLFVAESGNRRHLYEKDVGIDHEIGWHNSIADQIGIKGKAEDWVRKKIAQRRKSTGEWLDKLVDQITEIEKEYKAWQKREESL